MSLFPAYAQQDAETYDNGIGMQVQEVSPAREAQLLESEDEAPPTPAPQPALLSHDFYLDPKSDYGNLHVSTLYYPGRPQYAPCTYVSLGQRGPTAWAGRKRGRYFESDSSETARTADELAARQAAFRRMLADAPYDSDLWLRFIRFQERCAGTGAALETAVEAVSRAPHSRALHVAHHRLARRHLPPDTYLAVLRDHIANEKSPAGASELWIRLLQALGASPAACSAQALAAAATVAARAGPPALVYPHLVHEYGSFIRAAGLWELLVLLVELLASMSFPPTPDFPPPENESGTAEVERRLSRLEDEMSVCGLPLGARWVRVERARAAAHWRAAPSAPLADLADPQRAPLAADVADLLLPVADADAAFMLSTLLLRLAKVPMFPGAGYVRRAWAPGALEALDGCGEALLPLLRAARRLPVAHPARPARPARRPAAAARLLALLVDPPHYFSDDAGYLSWVSALWAASCSWAEGERRTALLCWWLRWLHALAGLLDPQEESGRAELRRLRGCARTALRRFAGGSPLPFAQFARLETLCSAAPLAADAAPLAADAAPLAADAAPPAAAIAARAALRAALRDRAVPLHQRLYVARVANEIPGPDSPGLWGVACAVLERPLPSDEELRGPAPAHLLEAALREAERRCDELEERLAAPDAPDHEAGSGAALTAALLPGCGEWAAARAALASPARTHELFLRAAAAPPHADASLRVLRYHEQAACAVVSAARRHHGLARCAARLAPRFPHNAFLAVASSGAGFSATAAEGEAGAEPRQQTECGALADLLPPMLRAVDAWDSGVECSAASRAAARVARRVAREGGAGATAWAALLEAAARADTPGADLLPATVACPAHKWLYVRGAAWCGAPGAELADVLLDKQLRLHALPDELAAAAEVAAEVAANADRGPDAALVVS